MAKLFKYKNKILSYIYSSVKDNTTQYTFERLIDISKKYGLPKLSVLSDTNRFLTLSNKDDLIEIDNDYSRIYNRYINNDTGYLWIKEKAVFEVVKNKINSCKTYDDLYITFLKYKNLMIQE